MTPTVSLTFPLLRLSVEYSNHHPINAFSKIKTANLTKNMVGFEGRALVMEMEQEEDFDGHKEGTRSGCGCGWFRVFSLNWWQGHEEEDKGLLDHQKSEGGEGWVMNKLKKVKETSEVFAGPKWKNFIRKTSLYGKKQHKRFQYDERSYALNFNSGAQSEDEDNIPPSFSTRFSAPLPLGSRQN